jgi:hypothetical protein
MTRHPVLRVPRATLAAQTLGELMRTVNNEYGWD